MILHVELWLKIFKYTDSNTFIKVLAFSFILQYKLYIFQFIINYLFSISYPISEMNVNNSF